MLGNFSAQHKPATAYLDLAANAHGDEKGSLVLRALARTTSAAWRPDEPITDEHAARSNAYAAVGLLP